MESVHHMRAECRMIAPGITPVPQASHTGEAKRIPMTLEVGAQAYLIAMAATVAAGAYSQRMMDLHRRINIRPDLYPGR